MCFYSQVDQVDDGSLGSSTGIFQSIYEFVAVLCEEVRCKSPHLMVLMQRVRT